jgi:hypothetical protein
MALVLRVHPDRLHYCPGDLATGTLEVRLSAFPPNLIMFVLSLRRAVAVVAVVYG